jgi:hypothetical protein
MARNLGTIPTSLPAANDVDWGYFVRLDIGGAVGTKRFTDYWKGDQTLSIDGSSQLWSAADLRVGSLDQGRQNVLSVSSIDFANLPEPPATEGQWTTWANTPGLRNVIVYVYVGWFDLAGAFAGSYKIYEGRVDNHELGRRAMLALKPHIASWSKQAPWAIPSPLCLYQYKDAQTCQYAGAEPPGETTCGKARANCVARGNQARFGSADLMPKRDEKIYWGDVNNA